MDDKRNIKDTVEITIERPTGPRITVAEPRSLGELAISKTTTITKTIASAAVVSTVAGITFLARHKYAIGSFALSSVAAGAMHFLLASTFMLTGAGTGSPTSGGFTPSCSQSTTWLARTSGLSATEQSAYDTMICGMVTDGTITGNMGTTGCGSVIDVLYIFATNTSTTALLNLCGTSFGGAITGGVTFSADNGFTSNGTTGFINTGYQPGGGSVCGNGAATCNYALNSASIATYGLTSRTSSSAAISIGAFETTHDTQIVPYIIGGAQEINANGGLTETLTNANGLFILTRVAASGAGSTNAYHYNSSATPTTSSNLFASTAIPTRPLYILGRNNAGTADSFITDQIAAAFIGSGLTLTQSNNISSRINAFMIAVGAGYHY